MNRCGKESYNCIIFPYIVFTDLYDQYKKQPGDSSSLGPYDYCSIMHYPIKVAGTGKTAFKILKSDVDINCIGQTDGATNIDIRKLDNLYS